MKGYYKGTQVLGEELPSGGLVGQVLIKKSNQSGDVEWSGALNNKVDKVPGMDLSHNDYDDEAKGIVDSTTSQLATKVDKEEGKGLYIDERV